MALGMLATLRARLARWRAAERALSEADALDRARFLRLGRYWTSRSPVIQQKGWWWRWVRR
jgi:hypothetical protein